MADNLTVGGNRVVRADDIGSGVERLLQFLGAVTATPTVLTGQQTLSVATGADTSLTVPTNATHALVTVDKGGGDIRYWENGVSPSTTAGLLIQAGDAAELTNLAGIRMRSTTGTVAVNVSYRRYDL